MPPYVFRVVDNLKMNLRRQGEDIIDLGMGNPDIPTPKHIVDKLVEAVQKVHNHRYSASAGITKLRHAITDWYKRRFDVDVDPNEEAIVTIGAKEGLSHFALAVVSPGDVVFARPNARPGQFNSSTSLMTRCWPRKRHCSKQWIWHWPEDRSRL